MSRRSGRIFVMVALLAVAALALPDGPAMSGGGNPRIMIPRLPIAFYVLLAALLAMGIVASTSSGFERKVRPGRRRGLRLLAILLVAIALWALVPPIQEGVGRLIDAIDFDGSSGGISTSDGDADGANQTLPSDRSGVLGAVLTILLAIIVLGSGGALFWMFSSQRIREEDADRIPFPEAMSAGRTDLESIIDPREAVIACYAQMRRAAVSAGTKLDDSDTPVETLGRLLRRHRVSKSSSTRLTELFQKARFSPHQIDESMRREALEALEAVRAEMMDTAG